MAASVITLCNAALGEIGARGLDSTADLANPDNDREALCAAHWQHAVLMVLAAHDWKRLEKEAALSADGSDTPLSLYAHRLPFPTEEYVARVVRVEPSTVYESRELFDYAIQGDSVISDSDAAVLRYIPFPKAAAGEEAAAFGLRLDAWFLGIESHLYQCFVLQLAARLVGPLTQNGAERQRILAELELALDKAKAADSAGQRMALMRDTTILESRFRGVL